VSELSSERTARSVLAGVGVVMGSGHHFAGSDRETEIALRFGHRQQNEYRAASTRPDQIRGVALKHGSIPTDGRLSPRLASVVQPDRFRTTDVRAAALNA
jgi:hypothetical protein